MANGVRSPWRRCAVRWPPGPFTPRSFGSNPSCSGSTSTNSRRGRRGRPWRQFFRVPTGWEHWWSPTIYIYIIYYIYITWGTFSVPTILVYKPENQGIDSLPDVFPGFQPNLHWWRWDMAEFQTASIHVLVPSVGKLYDPLWNPDLARVVLELCYFLPTLGFFTNPPPKSAGHLRLANEYDPNLTTWRFPKSWGYR